MEIFVFGSNVLGIHGKGAALTAKKEYGAVQGEGMGRTGNAYAIATKKAPTMKSSDIMPLKAIEWQVRVFIFYAKQYPLDTFIVTRIGCGLAGYKNEQIAPMFANAPDNCKLPKEWEDYIGV